MFARSAASASLAAARLALCAATLAMALAILRTRAPMVSPEPAAEPAPGVIHADLPGPYPARVLRIVDGDTFAARVPVWFGQEIETLVRLRGIDAPERAARCAEEAAGAERAAQALADLLAAGRVSLINVGRDKYFGRVVADVAVVSADGSFPDVDVGATLEAAGLARPYAGRRREGWCEIASR